MIRPRSSPGWALFIIATLTNYMQLSNLYDPSPFMNDFGIQDKATAQVISFLLILINIYDLYGAIQDSWKIYQFSFFSRFVAMGFFYALGPPWSTLVAFEGVTMVILGVAMWFGNQASAGGH